MRLLLCGVRGSTPAPGADFVRYGGSTSCVAVFADGEDMPRLVLDAGTGLANLSRAIGHRPLDGSILLTHLHWDHTHGLPFFPSGDHADARVTLYMPAQDGGPTMALARAMSPPHFPIGPTELGGRWDFRTLDEGTSVIEGLTVLAREIPHKGGRELGYRMSDGWSAVAYLPDHSPLALGPGPEGLGEYHEAALALAEGVDVLLHDAQHTAAELPERAYLGHSAVEYAVGLGERAGAGTVVLFHHDPERTDDEIDVIVAGQQDRRVRVLAAREGTVLHYGLGMTSGKDTR